MSTLTDIGLLLALLLSSVHLSPKQDVQFYIKGNAHVFDRLQTVQDYCVLFRYSPEGYQLLGNTSAHAPPSQQALPAHLRNRLNITATSIRITSLTLSDSGAYRWECWKAGILLQQQYVNLSVCLTAYEWQTEYVFSYENVDLLCNQAIVHQGSRIRWYRELSPIFGKTLILDTGLPFVPLRPVMNNQIFVLYNGSTLHLTSVTEQDLGHYYCQVLKEDTCLSFQSMHLVTNYNYTLHYVGERAVLPCSGKQLRQTGVEWTTPFGFFWSPTTSQDSSESPSSSLDPGAQMYVVDGSSSGNYSLVIPSLSANDTGSYVCSPYLGDKYSEFHALVVCPFLRSYTITFSSGSSADLVCHTHFTKSNRVMLFRRSGQQGILILDTKNPHLPIPPRQGSAVNVSYQQFSVILSNLSLQDSGEYLCAVLEETNTCISGASIQLVSGAQDSFGITSCAVHAALMGCGLMGMICAVITVTVKARRDPASTCLDTRNRKGSRETCLENRAKRGRKRRSREREKKGKQRDLPGDQSREGKKEEEQGEGAKGGAERPA